MSDRKLSDASIGIVLLGLYVGTMIVIYSLCSARTLTVPLPHYIAPSTTFSFR